MGTNVVGMNVRSTCTMKQCRRLLEKDLDLPATALDSFKAVVSDEVDRVRQLSLAFARSHV